MSLEDYRDDVETCFGTSCGFCERKCPVYQIRKKKTFTSRGRNRAILGIIEGKVKPSKALAEAYYQCMMCGCCDRWCALPDTEIEREDLGAWKEDISFASPEETSTLFFAGCTMPLKQPETLRKLVELMGPGTMSVMESPVCCGSYVVRTGYEKEYSELTDRFIDYLNGRDISEIITACPGCYTTLKEKLAETMPDISVVHTTLKLKEMLDSGEITVARNIGKTTYHDPCHLGRLEGIIEEPRAILRKISDFVEMQDSGYDSNCCGAGGGVRAAFPELSEEIGKKRMREAQDTKADILVSSCPFCEAQFESIGGMEVMDIVDALWKAVK
jgi:Fe-S oxidoreductase